MDITYADRASLEVVFKVQETCNINCTYCYMYNMGNEAYKIVPQQQASDIIWAGVASFIIEENKRRDPRYVRIVFHGGEPTLIKPEVFQRRITVLMSTLAESLTPHQLKNIDLSIQTNGMLINDAWVEILKKWRISTGVSLDGPKDVHDARRVDKKGEPTYDRVMVGVRRLQLEDKIKKRGLGALAVIDPNANGAVVYRHLADDVGFAGFNFLLPFMNWDNYDPDVVDGVGDFLVAAFKEWCKDINDGTVRNIRIFREAIDSFKMINRGVWEKNIRVAHDVIVVECDGTIMTEESLRPTFSGLFSKLNVCDVSVDDIRSSPQFEQVAIDSYSYAPECTGCVLLHACRSGAAMGRVGLRYTSSSDQVRKSVYCSAFIALYVEVAAFLKVNSATIPHLDLYDLSSNG